jgi:hypothetical protein
MPFNFNTHDTKTRADEGVPMVVLNLRSGLPELNDDGTPVTITLHGQNSDIFEKSMATIQATRAEMRNAGKTITPEHQRQEDINLVIACTADWTPFEVDGHMLTCTPQNISKFWNDRRFQTTRRVALAWIQNDANFLPAGSMNSKDTLGSSSSSAGPSLKAVTSGTHSAASG